MITVKDLTMSFKKREVLKSINLRLGVGVYGLLGANGAGKTTLIRCLAGLYEPQCGVVLFRNRPLNKFREYHRVLGYLPQSFGMFPELTLYEMMEYISSLKGLTGSNSGEKIMTALRYVNLEDRAKDRVKDLSGGMVRRAGIAQAILGEPSVLLLDEPTAGLDPTERIRFKNLISNIKNDKTILLSTHIVEDVEACCENVIVIDQGAILFDGPCGDLRNRALGKVYQVDESDYRHIAHEVHLLKVSERDGRTYYRILAREGLEFPSESPTLEDGYMYVVRFR